MAKYLYGASVQGIQEFIFATNELKSIIGASEIISNINKKIEEKYAPNIIINAAGNIKLLFSEKEAFEDLVKSFTKTVKQNAYGITISQAVEVFEEGDLKNAFNRLEKKLATSRNQPEIPLDMSINILKPALKSAKPIVAKDKDKATLQKEEAYVKDEAYGEITSIKNKKNKIAVIHADGNGLGAMIATLSKNTENDEAVQKVYSEFSLALDIATRKAIESAKAKLPNMKLRQVILGGDDLTVVCDANNALAFTEYFLEAFEQETAGMKGLGKDGLTACAGIAYCNYKYPFHYAVNLAESLCAEAKGHSRKINAALPPSSLMFHNIQSSNFSSYRDYIDNELILNEGEDAVHLNYGPYFIEKQTGYARVKDFQNLAFALNEKGNPLSRFREWLTLLGQNKHAAKTRLERISQMMDLKKALYNKEILQKCLTRLDPALNLESLTVIRDEKHYTPVYDVTAHLSVIDAGKNTYIEEEQL